MRINLLLILAMIVLLSITIVSAYTAPPYTNVPLIIGDAYTAPAYTNVPLVLDDVSASTTCTITTTTTITSDLDCSGTTFAISNNADVTINSGITVTALNTTIESGSSIANAGNLYNGVS